MALGRALPHATGLRHADLDITDVEGVRRVIGRLEPQLIVNTAVIGVDECERRPDLARAVNVDGPAALAASAARCSAIFMHFSSNYVFDGIGERDPYTIDDEPRPINVYGRTKLEGEQIAAERCGETFVIRTSWVYGRGKSSFLAATGEKLRHGQKVRAISDTWASCTYAEDLVQRVLLVIDRGVFGTYHIVNDGVCSHETFARQAARHVGVPVEIAERLIEVITETQMQRQAPRPRYTPMRCLLSERLGFERMRPWQAALGDYLTLSPARTQP
jgi:dTDP-4-dehydrorhamnose reductase